MADSTLDPSASGGPSGDYARLRGDALARLAAGDAAAAFQEFRWTLWYPAAPDPDRLGDALGVMAQVFAAMGHQELAGHARAAAADVHDPDRLWDLGYQLIEADLPAIAATVLRRCLDVVPGSEQVLTELIAALERMMAYADARRLLEAHPQLVESSFMCRYLLAYNAAFTGDLATTRRMLPSLAGESDPTHAFMASRIETFLARADRVAGLVRLDDRDLRGWHHVLTGGLLTHISPFGHDEPMRGRYAWLQDSYARVRTGLDRLVAVLAAWDIAPACVYALPGRDHEIVAAAAAQVLGVATAPWPAIGAPAPGIVVAYDLTQADWPVVERLVQRRPDQILWAHAAAWDVDGPLAPEVVTLLYQSLVSPWAERLVVGAEGKTERSPADDRPIAELAAEIVAAAPLDGDDVIHDDLAGLDALARAAGAPAPGRRERWWAGSPVASNRFV